VVPFRESPLPLKRLGIKVRTILEKEWWEILQERVGGVNAAWWSAGRKK
jgi:hypothetical protein